MCESPGPGPSPSCRRLGSGEIQAVTKVSVVGLGTLVSLCHRCVVTKVPAGSLAGSGYSETQPLISGVTLTLIVSVALL